MSAFDENLIESLHQTAATIDAALKTRLPGIESGCPSKLVEAMQYSIEAGGKRLRPALVIWSCELCGGSREKALAAALAVECVHTFSLIHDDLPALDNDDLRRGRPSNHKKFGEATAILAGDALLTLAFEIIAEDVRYPAIAAAMIRELAKATGWQGMIGGESADLEGEAKAPDAALVRQIHLDKTARLIEAACRLGGLAAGGSAGQVEALACYGRELGLAFQAADDILDITGTRGALGKTAGKDERSGKQTYPRAVGMEESRKIAAAARDRAIAALTPFGAAAARLAALARFVVDRES